MYTREVDTDWYGIDKHLFNDTGVIITFYEMFLLLINDSVIV